MEGDTQGPGLRKTLWTSSRMAWARVEIGTIALFYRHTWGLGGLDMRLNAGPRAIESRSLSQMWF